MAHIFISYATPDRPVADEISRWLRAAGHEPFLDHDLRDGISVGEHWKQRLYRELHEVDAVIGVVTSSFVASTWCGIEVGIADALGCRLIPVRAEASMVHPLMRDLQYADYQADRQQARERVLQAVRLLGVGGGAWGEGKNPFPGLEPFTAELSRVFFGRAGEAREVSNRLRAMGSAGGILAIVGSSGCGKSSLVNAAVMPLVDSDPTWLAVPTLVPGTDPLPELARMLAATATRLKLSWSASDVRGRLEAGTDGLRRVADDLLAAGPVTRRRLLITIDQAEELFTRTTSDARQRFAQLLCDAVAGPMRVVAAMRSEFLDDLRDVPELAGMPIDAYVLAPLDRAMLREVIEGPATVAKLRLDSGLAAALVADTDSGEALPLLAFILRQLADGLPAGGALTLSRYRDLGGVQGALTRHADAALAEAVASSGLTDREVLAGLTRLVTIDETGRRARRRIKLASLTGPLQVALRVFVDRHLLIRGADDNDQVWLTVAHEALFTGWRPLDTATADIIAALRTARAVEQAAAEWNDAQRPAHFLWDAERLTATLATLGILGDGGSRDPASPSLVECEDEARAFLDATGRHVHVVKERERRRRTLTIAVLSTLLLLVTTASLFAFQQRRTAQAQRDTAIFDQITAQADRLRSTDVSLAAQLDLIAYRMRPTPDLYAALITTENAALATPLAGHTDSVYAVAFSPDGRTLVSGSNDQTVRLWNVINPAHSAPMGLPLTGHTNGVDAVAFSPDGHTLATGSLDRTVRLWNVSDPAHPTSLGQALTGHTDIVNAVAFSPDGRTVASGSNDQTVRLWNVSDPARPTSLGQPLTGHTDVVNAVAFSPDGRTLASGSADKTVGLWNVSDPAHPTSLGQPLTGHTTYIIAVAFSPDGHTLASGSADRTVRLWNVTDPAHPTPLGQPLTGHTDYVNSVAFSPDGHTLASGSGDRTVRLWNVTDPTHPTALGQPLTGHTTTVIAVAFSPDGHTLASGSADQTVRLWNIPYALMTGHTDYINNYINAVAFSSDGRTLASGSGDNTVRLWDVTDPTHSTPLGPLTGHTDYVDSVAISPKRHTLASGSADHTVRLWNVTDPTHPSPLGPPLTGHTDIVSSLAFSPDGRILASGSVDQTVRLWDVADPAHPMLLSPLTGHTNSVNAVAFSPDGHTLASGGGDSTVRLWNVTDPAHPTPLGQPLTGHTSYVNAVAFSSDGRTLASGSADQSVRLWNVTHPSHPLSLDPPLTGHTNPVFAVAFSSDGRTLASGSGDSTVRLWNVTDPAHSTPLGTLTGHTDYINALAFSPDGHTLASGSRDQTARLWEMNVDQATQRICTTTMNTLTPTKWEQYVSPDLPYRPPCL